MFGGRNMGGGVGGGGSLLRSVGRAVTRANFPGGTLQEPISSSSSSSSGTSTTNATTNSRHAQKSNSSSSNNISLSSPSSASSSSSSPFASFNVPLSSIYGIPTSSSWPHSEEFDWVSVVEGCEDQERPYGFVDDYFVLGPVPSQDEVNTAVSALQQVFNADSYSNLVRDKFAPELDKNEEHWVMSPTGLGHRVSPVGSELDWMEPSICMCNSKMLQRHGSERVYDAFRLLRTEPLVQKMVKSLSSDEAVWNAVLNNEVVRELRESFSAEEDSDPRSPDESPEEDSNEATNIVKWLFDSTRGKIMEVVEKITKLVNDLFQPSQNEKSTNIGGTDLFKEKLRTSFMLSIMVLLVVVVARAHTA